MAYSEDLDVRITDSSLRDGSHAKRHKFSESDVRRIALGLDRAGVPVIEVSHGDGLGGSSFTYGESAVDEQGLIRAVAETVRSAKVACLLLPGVGTMDDIRAAQGSGASIIRVATHCTEADISIEHFELSRGLGLETVGFLMMAHSQPPQVLARQARIMAEAGCQCVYVVDSAGAMILDQVIERVAAVGAELDGIAQVGFHGHQNLSLGVANSVLAMRAGAVQIDACTRSFGAGAGNTPTEVLVAVLDRLGIRTGIDPIAMLDVAEEVVRPVMDKECTIDRMSLIMGYAGVYSSFLLHAQRVAELYGVSGAEILMRAGERRLVGGQEDQLVDIALEISDARSTANAAAAAVGGFSHGRGWG